MRSVLLAAALGLAGMFYAPVGAVHARSGALGFDRPIDVSDFSAAKRKRARRTATPRLYRQAPRSGPIACMRGGCNPIPAGCRIEPERTIDGMPTGFDTAVCPYR